MNNKNDQIALLVKEIQSGSGKAFEQLYKLTNQSAYFVALKIVKSEHDAQDILQDSYITVLSKIKELDKPESFVNWFNQIVANKAKDYLKKKTPSLFESDEEDFTQVIPDEDTAFSPHENLDQAEAQKLVMEIIDNLSDEKRMCVLLYYYDEMSIPDIAKSLGVPEGTVKSRLYLARKDVEKEVKGLEKKGTKLYGAAPIPLVIWALKNSSVVAGAAFAKTAASAAIVSGAAAAIASAGTTGTVAAGGIVAAKIAALTIAQKVVAGVAVAGIVAGTATGSTKLIQQSKEAAEPIESATTVFSEEMTREYLRQTLVFETETAQTEEPLQQSSAAYAQTRLGTRTQTTAAQSAMQGTVSAAEKATVIQTAKATLPSSRVTTTRAPRTTVANTTNAETTTQKPADVRKVIPAQTAPTTTMPTTTEPTNTEPTTTEPTTTEPTTATPTTEYNPRYLLFAGSETEVSQLGGRWDIYGDVHFNNSISVGGNTANRVYGNASSAKTCTSPNRLVMGQTISNAPKVTMPNYDDLILSVAPTFPEGVFNSFESNRVGTEICSTKKSAANYYTKMTSIYTNKSNVLTMKGPVVITDGWYSPWETTSNYIGDLYIDGNATFNGSISVITGNLYVTGDINFACGSITVGGNIYSKGKVYSNAWTLVDINGTIYTQGNCEFPGSATKSFKSIYAKGKVQINGISDVNGNIYCGGDLTFSGNSPAVTTHNCAIYCGGTFTSQQGFNTEGVAVVENDIKIGGRPCVIDGELGALVLYSRNGNIDMSPGTVMTDYGMIYAPHGTITFMSGNMSFYGNIIADVIKLSPGGMTLGKNTSVPLPFSKEYNDTFY